MLPQNDASPNRQGLLRLLGRSALFSILIGTSSIFAHGEEFNYNTQPSGPIYLSEGQAKLIELKTVKASKKPLSQRLGLNGTIQLMANSQADVSVRISGNVSALYANLGDIVSEGQPLIKVQSLLIGDPPPSVVMKAPMAGIIDSRNVSLGQAVVPNTVLFHISNRSQVLVIAKVYEEDVGKVALGQIAALDVLSYPNHYFNGKVTLIEPNIDPLTRTVNVQIIVDNADHLLKPGMFVRTNLILQDKQDALVIPNEAIIEANNQFFVFIKQGDSYEKRLIKTGIEDKTFTEVIEGITLGEEAVTQGNRQIYTLWLTGGQPQAAEH